MGCVGMSKIIGITGYMGAGKTYNGNQIQKKLKNCYFLEVDKFRRNLIKSNYKYRNRLETILNLKGNWTGKDLNDIIYKNPEAMTKYKKILYEFLIRELKRCPYDYVLIEWALLIQDHLLPFLDALIIVEASSKTRLKRVSGIDLREDEIKNRMLLQEQENIDEILKQYKEENPTFLYFKITNEEEGGECAMYVPNSKK